VPQNSADERPTDHETADTCTCPNGDTWRCILGSVYGPCSSPDCGGVCTYEGYCTCTLHKWPNGLGKDDPDHEPPEQEY
jgi:hypothetical protein